MHCRQDELAAGAAQRVEVAHASERYTEFLASSTISDQIRSDDVSSAKLGGLLTYLMCLSRRRQDPSDCPLVRGFDFQVCIKDAVLLIIVKREGPNCKGCSATRG